MPAAGVDGDGSPRPVASALTGPEPERSRPAWARARVDPAGPLLALVAGVVYALHGFGHYLSRDLALYAYAGQRVADGVAPYEGVVNRSGPLSHLVPGVGAFLGRLVGVDDLLAMRAFFLVLSMACVWLAYVMGRDLLHSRAAGWPSPPRCSTSTASPSTPPAAPARRPRWCSSCSPP